MIKISKNDLVNLITDLVQIRLGQDKTTVRTGNLSVTVSKFKRDGLTYWRANTTNIWSFKDLVLFIVENYL